MNGTTGKKNGLRPVAGEAPSSDWFYDELMTAQPEATREYYRARLNQPARPAAPKKAD
jgi:hypothetical protein